MGQLKWDAANRPFKLFFLAANLFKTNITASKHGGSIKCDTKRPEKAMCFVGMVDAKD